jgi:hypothetical protein
VGRTKEPVTAQLRSAAGRSSKVIKDRQRVEATVNVPGAGKLVLIVDSEGRYILRTVSQGSEASAGAQLLSGEMRAAEHESDKEPVSKRSLHQQQT